MSAFHDIWPLSLAVGLLMMVTSGAAFAVLFCLSEEKGRLPTDFLLGFSVAVFAIYLIILGAMRLGEWIVTVCS